MRKVILESPFASDNETGLDLNLRYARAAVRDCVVTRGEAPIASHLLLTQPGILNDTVPDERRLGMRAGLAWGASADATVVYIDRGISPGMKAGITHAVKGGRPVEFRSLDPHDPDTLQRQFERELGIGTQHLQKALTQTLNLLPKKPESTT